MVKQKNTMVQKQKKDLEQILDDRNNDENFRDGKKRFR